MSALGCRRVSLLVGQLVRRQRVCSVSGDFEHIPCWSEITRKP